jgi:hypothetical protein
MILLAKSPLSPLFQRGGPKSPLCKGGRAQRGGILTHGGRGENIRQQYQSLVKTLLLQEITQLYQ